MSGGVNTGSQRCVKLSLFCTTHFTPQVQKQAESTYGDRWRPSLLLVWRVWAALKNKQTPITTPVKTDLVTLPRVSHKYIEKAQIVFYNLIIPLAFAARSVGLLKILGQVST